MAATTDDMAVSKQAQLNLMDIADVQTVQTFDAPELGWTFIFFTPGQNTRDLKNSLKTRPHRPHLRRSVSESKTSVRVYAMGR
jgi:hypothetical protein